MFPILQVFRPDPAAVVEHAWPLRHRGVADPKREEWGTPGMGRPTHITGP